MISQNSAPQQNLVTAPKLHISRNKINWTDEGVKEYETVVSPHLQDIRKRWLDPDSLSSMSIVLKMTNTILSSSAVATNKSQSLDSNFNHRSRRIPLPVLRARRRLARTNRLKNVSAKLSINGLPSSKALEDLRSARNQYKQALRKAHVMASRERDRKLFEILDENPHKIYSFLKSSRKCR